MSDTVQSTCHTSLKTALSGRELLDCPVLNKGNAFDSRERDLFGLHGLLPARIATLEEQADLARARLAALPDNFSRHIALREIQDRNETLFYAIIDQALEAWLPIIYTPAIGRACREFSHIWTRPRGLFLNYTDRGRIAEILSDPQWDGVRVIVASDGGSILGIGDQGANGMGIPIGKLSLYTACGGLNPARALPILLDVGTDNVALLEDPEYIGWRHKRVRGADYDAFIAEFVDAVNARWPNIALHWEDLSGADALRILRRYRDGMCTYNDDIQGTAGVTAGALLAAIRAGAAPLAQQRIVIFGAGGAGCGIADLLAQMMVAEGMTPDEANRRFFMVDINGLVRAGMDGVTEGQHPFVQPADIAATWNVADAAHVTLAEVMENVRPTMLIGTSGQGGAFTRDIVAPMAQQSVRPVIFALSNPTANIEATPADLLEWTDGRAIIGTGGPFAPVEYDGCLRPVDQINNSYVFPGVGLAVVAGGITRMTDGMFLAAAHALAGLSPAAGVDDQATVPLLPPVSELRTVAMAVARAVIRQGQVEGVAPQATPETLEAALKAAVWTARYRPYEKADSVP